MSEIHNIMGGKVRLYRRPNSNKWQCATSLNGQEQRSSTRCESLSKAKDVAEDWYLELRGKARTGELRGGKKFKFVAELFWKEYPVVTEGQRSELYTQMHRERLDNYLIPYFGKLGVKDVTAGKIHEYRIWRKENGLSGKPPSRSTMHQEIVTIRLVLKTALRHGWLEALPDMSVPHKTKGKLEHRPWFSPDEYKKLYSYMRERCKDIRSKHHRWANEQLRDLILFLANTGMRPDEAANLQYRDVEIVEDDETGETILVIAAHGKRGVGWCKSMPGAVHAFERLVERNEPASSDLVFPKMQRRLFKTVLEELDLKKDRNDKDRTLYSLRHYYISTRLMNGADIYEIAKNCRTSVEVIQSNYAKHIQNYISTSAINVRKAKPKYSKNKTPNYSDQ